MFYGLGMCCFNQFLVSAVPVTVLALPRTPELRAVQHLGRTAQLASDGVWFSLDEILLPERRKHGTPATLSAKQLGKVEPFGSTLWNASSVTVLFLFDDLPATEKNLWLSQ